MNGREPIGKKTRFEVFKRDSFTCQYCGGKAPEAILEVDHIDPVANGGSNDLLNLVSSCKGCNSGKGARLLSDDSVVVKRRRQVEELQERREQIAMVMEWHRGLVAVRSMEAYAACEYTDEILASFGQRLSDAARVRIGEIVKSAGLQDFLHSCDIAFSQYASATEAIEKIGGIAENRKRNRANPERDSVAYLFGIARRRFGYFENWQLKTSVRILREADVEWSWIHATAKKCDSLYAFRQAVEARLRTPGQEAQTSTASAPEAN